MDPLRDVLNNYNSMYQKWTPKFCNFVNFCWATLEIIIWMFIGLFML